MQVFEFGQGQGVVGANPGWFALMDGDECFRQSLVLMLTRDLLQPIIQFLAATAERLPIMAPS